jgi:phosphatidylserine/phosphatidylglycerophosphate/cardiolipin synthase-like enzyme
LLILLSLFTEEQGMDWLLISTGFTGALTLVFLCRRAHRWFKTPLSLAVHFSPKGGCTDVIVRRIRSARHEVLIQAYSFTSKPIAEALVDAKSRGLHVEIILDRANEQESYSELNELLGDGMNPLIDAEHAIAHNKIIILDGKTVITGSFNFTNQAEHENAENMIVIEGHPELARAYRMNFLDHKAHAKPADRKKAKPPAPAHKHEQKAA